MEQFVRVVERAEARSKAKGMLHGDRHLSGLMCESWKTGRFWFDHAARKPFHVDNLFYAHPNEGGASIDSLDDDLRS
jgi:hypothetical protein